MGSPGVGHVTKLVEKWTKLPSYARLLQVGITLHLENGIRGDEMKTVIVFLGGFFSIILPTAEGVRTVERQLLDVARSFRASERLIFTSLVIPGTLPFIVSGLRIAVGRVLAGVIIAEFYAQTQGLGVMILKSGYAFNSARMMFGILLFTLLGIILYEAVGIGERHFGRWRPSLEEAP